MIKHNQSLQKEHQRAREEEQEEERLIGRYNAEQYAAFHAQERSRRMKEIEDREKYRQDLLMDISESSKDHVQTMNEVERSLNMDAMNAIHSDPHFNSRLAHRMRMTIGTPTPRPAPSTRWDEGT